MKLHMFFVAALIQILICGGCVAYNYSDPYPNENYPYGYNSYPYRYNHSVYSPYYPQYRSIFYPNIFLDFRYRGHRDHGVFRGYRDHGHYHRGGRY